MSKRTYYSKQGLTLLQTMKACNYFTYRQQQGKQRKES